MWEGSLTPDTKKRRTRDAASSLGLPSQVALRSLVLGLLRKCSARLCGNCGTLVGGLQRLRLFRQAHMGPSFLPAKSLSATGHVLSLSSKIATTLTTKEWISRLWTKSTLLKANRLFPTESEWRDNHLVRTQDDALPTAHFTGLEHSTDESKPPFGVEDLCHAGPRHHTKCPSAGQATSKRTNQEAALVTR